MVWQKVRYEEFHPYIIEREDSLNWVLYEIGEVTNKGVTRTKERRLSYHHSLAATLKEIALQMADSVHTITVQQYLDELNKATASIMQHATALQPVEQTTERKPRKAKKQEQPIPTSTLLLEEE